MTRARVVITHDFMETYGGAERVTQEMAAAFPDAPVVAMLGRPSVAERMQIGDRFHSVLAPRRRVLARYRALAPVFPLIADRVGLPEADVVLSSSYAYAHRFGTRGEAPRVCYCHSPLRFAWSMTEGYRDELAGGAVSGRAFELFAAAMRLSDRRSAQGVDEYLTQSPFTADQIRRFYGREATVIGAPVDCERFHPGGEPRDYFLLCGRLIEPYKKATVAIEAFRRLGRRLVVAGDGPALNALRAAAPPNVEFAGHLADHELVPLMQGCLAAVFPSRDDFGLIPVEVMACGRPVIAFGAGGALHTVLPGRTGELFGEQTPESLHEAVSAFDPGAYDPQVIRAHAEQWDRTRFRQRIVEAVDRASRAEV